MLKLVKKVLHYIVYDYVESDDDVDVTVQIWKNRINIDITSNKKRDLKYEELQTIFEQAQKEREDIV